MRKLILATIAVIAQLTLNSAYAASLNDPFFPQQWSLHNDGTQSISVDIDDLHTLTQAGVVGTDIGWLEAQPEIAKKASSPVIVAVIDTGIDPKHPDLVGRISPDSWNFLNNSARLQDDMGHGTHVSGIIAANAGNGIGISGVAPASVQILSLRVLSKSFVNFSYNKKLITDYIADAVNYAVAHHASIINMSLSWPKLIDDANVDTAIRDAIKAGVMIVASAGNDRKDEPTYPCSYEGVICVGAISNNAKMTLYSNYGGLVDLLAPGDEIVSLYPTEVDFEGVPLVPSQTLRIQGYEILSGTSQASPEVAGVAAIIKSAMPNITMEEWKARLFASTISLPHPGAALYGKVSIPGALDASPQPIYLPDFKALPEITVAEGSLQASGNLTIENLWAPATSVSASITINGKPAGSAQKQSFATAEQWVIPWTYTFSSLDESSTPTLALTITDSRGTPQTFQVSLSLVRAMSAIASQQTYSIPTFTLPGATQGDTKPNWIGSSVNGLYLKLSNVVSYPSEIGLPKFFQAIAPAAGSSGLNVMIYDPANTTNPLQVVPVPGGLSQLAQVIRLDANGDGKRDWVITGVIPPASPSAPPTFQFYFLGPDFKPLWGAASVWQIPLDPTFGGAISGGGFTSSVSWIADTQALGTGKLIPAFLANGPLPPLDNYDILDARYTSTAEHLYYLSPIAGSSMNAPVQLEIHALDSANFRNANPDFNLQTPLPQSPADKTAGHLRVMVAIGQGLTAQSEVWDITSIAQTSVNAAAGWDPLSAAGVATKVRPDGSISLLDVFDSEHQSITWCTNGGQFEDRVDYSFVSPANPLETLVGAFEFPGLGRYWFVEAGFDLVGYHQPVGQTGANGLVMKTTPIERESSFSSDEFNEMLSPIVVGTADNPQPGAYVDSTLVRGNRVSVIVWDPVTDQMQRPIRYSMEVPAGCLQMPPVQMSVAPGSVGVPLFCQSSAASGLEFRVVTPNPIN